jgi:hypothetical protein
MAGLLRTQECSPAGRELFRLLCVGICGRPSNGQILLDHYRYKRRRFAGDERVCHQSVTAMRRPAARAKAPADDAFASPQRRANKQRSSASAGTSVGGHAHSIRMVNEAAGGTIGWSWHPLFAPRRANLVRDRPSFRFTINFPNDNGQTNSSSAQVRLNLKKPLYRASADPEHRW